MRLEITSSRSPVSRETRLLLLTILISFGVLWLLARLRFPESAAMSNPVPPVISQLGSMTPFEDLSFALRDLRPRVAASIVPLNTPVLRTQRNTGITLVHGAAAESVVAWDPASGIAVVRLPEGDVPTLKMWSPISLDYPRYLVAADTSLQHVSLRPVFVGTLSAMNSPLWSGPIWLLPATVSLEPGTFVFTTDGALAGLAVRHNAHIALVSPDTVVTTGRRLIEQKGALAGTIGIETQPMSPTLSEATRAPAGVMVTWVDPHGPAAGIVEVTDVIEAIDEQPLATDLHWRARAARVHPGEVVALQLRRGNETRRVQITATLHAPSAKQPVFGLTLRRARPSGAEVLTVQPGSAGARASMQPGDVITSVGSLRAPTPRQVVYAFDQLHAGSLLLVAITRGESHHVVVIRKP
jgi:S1-C subfamily serine protease